MRPLSRPAALAVLVAAPLHAQLPSPSAISAEIAANGAKAVVARLNHTPPNAPGQTAWDLLTHQIWIGRPAYIHLAPALAQGTDAGPSEDLGISLAHALPIAPASVLRVLDPADGPVLGVTRVCGIPFLEDTVPNVRGYVRRTRTALRSINDSALQATRAACLKQLDASAAHLPPSR